MAQYKIEIKKSAIKELNRVSNKDLRKIVEKIKELAKNPRPEGSIKLSEEEKYRIRHGNYRILYMIEDNLLIVYVVKIAQRKDVYR